MCPEARRRTLWSPVVTPLEWKTGELNLKFGLLIPKKEIHQAMELQETLTPLQLTEFSQLDPASSPVLLHPWLPGAQHRAQELFDQRAKDFDDCFPSHSLRAIPLF